jgi:hypothetical protein
MIGPSQAHARVPVADIHRAIVLAHPKARFLPSGQNVSMIVNLRSVSVLITIGRSWLDQANCCKARDGI